MTEQGKRDAPGAERIHAMLAGERWEELSFDFLKEWWSSFCYLTPEATRYYLPALLITALDHWGEEVDFSHTVVYSRLMPSAYAIYYHGSDSHFEGLAGLLTKEQFRAVAAFLALFLPHSNPGNTLLLRGAEPSHMMFLASRAMRLFWERAGGPHAEAFAAFDWQMRHYEYPAPEDPAAAALVEEIRSAFADAPYPGDNNLSGSRQGDEAAEIALDLRGVHWRTIAPWLLADNSTATSFLTHEGLRYYLPAFLIADLMEFGGGRCVFTLTHGFTESNFSLYPDTDWFAYGVERMAGFTLPERLAIIRYLEYTAEQEDYEAANIHEALERYWRPSLGNKGDVEVAGDKT
ncbi:hypothetical protein CCAX7_29160 [Capsulimonas corticalis]|uniref:Uncharacterized protein n=1 Tax=Capsulimonas corticalis TaxID=2219043 RepID=A0A402CT45_9BACT|nr:hypothetical protein CCAX7_29160 [Capsulimonas corticalis]